MLHIRKNQTLFDYDEKSGIVDYNKRDFREFWLDKNMKIVNYLESLVIKKLLINKEGWFLDLGCGFGRLLPLYKNKNKNIVMVDFAINHLQMIEKRINDKNVFLVAANAINLPFKEDTFNSIICIRLFHHLSNPKKLVSEIHRISNNSANILISYINKRNLLRIIKHGKKTNKKSHDECEPAIYYTHPKYFDEIIKMDGLVISKTKGSGFIYQITHSSKKLKNIIEKSCIIYYFVTVIGRLSDIILGNLNLSHVNYVRVKFNKNQKNTKKHVQKIIDILKCPVCNNDYLIETEKSVVCTNCKTSFNKVGKVYDFRI